MVFLYGFYGKKSAELIENLFQYMISFKLICVRIPLKLVTNSSANQATVPVQTLPETAIELRRWSSLSGWLRSSETQLNQSSKVRFSLVFD